jgi:hypothetical protein
MKCSFPEMWWSTVGIRIIMGFFFNFKQVLQVVCLPHVQFSYLLVNQWNRGVNLTCSLFAVILRHIHDLLHLKSQFVPERIDLILAESVSQYCIAIDIFLQVTQQSMWGRDNENSQKGMNFASVAATGAVANNGAAVVGGKFIDSIPPQVKT